MNAYHNTRTGRADKKHLEVIKKRSIRYKKIFSRDQALADDIWSSFNRKIPFPRVMKMIKTKGHQAVYRIFNEVRKSKADNPLALFIWKIKNEKINWKNGDSNDKK